MSKQKRERLELKTDKRTIVGKNVKKLRREGKLPANIYGEDFKSTSVTVDHVDFSKIFRHAGETSVVYLALGADEIPVLVQNVQKHPLDNSVLHIDFRKVNLNKKIEAQVPVTLIGESEAVAKKGGVLLNLTDSLTVEALPASLPDHIEVDISSLAEIDSEIKVSDLKKGADFEFKDEPEKVIVRVTEHKEEELTPQVEVEMPEDVSEAQATETGEEGAEGETPTEGADDNQPAKEETPQEKSKPQE